MRDRDAPSALFERGSVRGTLAKSAQGTFTLSYTWYVICNNTTVDGNIMSVWNMISKLNGYYIYGQSVRYVPGTMLTLTLKDRMQRKLSKTCGSYSSVFARRRRLVVKVVLQPISWKSRQFTGGSDFHWTGREPTTNPAPHKHKGAAEVLNACLPSFALGTYGTGVDDREQKTTAVL